MSRTPTKAALDSDGATARAWELVPAAAAVGRPRSGLEKAALDLSWANKLRKGLQAPFGGPSAAGDALLLAGTGAALGYGAGELYDRTLRPNFQRPGYAPKNLATLGALAGGLASVPESALAITREGGLHGLFKTSAEYDPEELRFEKAGIAGGLRGETIPVDRFNRVVLGDYLTPQPIRAATAGLVEAADRGRGFGGWVSPMDVARVAVGAGAGWGSGLVVGRTLGALAGLTPEAQRRVQDAGLMAGALNAAIGGAFGGR